MESITLTKKELIHKFKYYHLVHDDGVIEKNYLNESVFDYLIDNKKYECKFLDKNSLITNVKVYDNNLILELNFSLVYKRNSESKNRIITQADKELLEEDNFEIKMTSLDQDE